MLILNDGRYHFRNAQASYEVIEAADDLKPYSVVCLDSYELGKDPMGDFTLKLLKISVEVPFSDCGFERAIQTVQLTLREDQEAAIMAWGFVAWLNYDLDPGIYVLHPMQRDHWVADKFGDLRLVKIGDRGDARYYYGN